MTRTRRGDVWVVPACLAAIVVALLCSPAAVSAAEPTTVTSAIATTEPVSATTRITSTKRVSGGLVVLAAASLTESFGELGERFEAANPGVHVIFNFAGSQQLAQQIALGAPADVFASANKAQMKAAIETGRVVSGTEQVFVRNRLIVVAPKDNPGRVVELKDLARPGLKLVLAAKEVPVGQYALDFLTKATADPAFGPDFEAAVLKNVVSYEQNVKAVLSKVVLGEADAGIVYSTDAASEKSGKTVQLAIPDALNTVAVYPIAVLSDTGQLDTAQAFVDFVLSPAGQDVLAGYGFIKRGP